MLGDLACREPLSGKLCENFRRSSARGMIVINEINEIKVFGYCPARSKYLILNTVYRIRYSVYGMTLHFRILVP